MPNYGMSEFLLVMTIVIQSPQTIHLSIEKVSLTQKKTIASAQYEYANTQEGFSRLQADSEGLQAAQNLPSADCVFNLNKEKTGFLNNSNVPPSSVKGTAEPIPSAVRQLADICRKEKARF